MLFLSLFELYPVFPITSIPVLLEQHLAGCLKVLFSPGDEEPQAVLRFWDPLLNALHDNLLLGAYPHCSIELQVRELLC